MLPKKLKTSLTYGHKCILQAGVGHVAAGALVAHHDNIQVDVTFILRGFGSFCDEK